MPGSEYGNIPFADDIKELIDELDTKITDLTTIISDFADIMPLGLIKNYTVSDTELVVTTGYDVTTSMTYTPMPKAKLTLKSYIYPNSLFRFKFDINDNGGSGHTVYGKIYRNGVAIGSEQSTNSQTPVTKTQDINIQDWNIGDVLQVWGKRADSYGACKVEKFTLC